MTRIATLPRLQPVELDVTNVRHGIAAKTTYRTSSGDLVTLLQAQSPQLPEVGSIVPVRGTVGKQQGTALYWFEEGWLVATTTGPSGDPRDLAELVEWQVSG